MIKSDVNNNLDTLLDISENDVQADEWSNLPPKPVAVIQLPSPQVRLPQMIEPEIDSHFKDLEDDYNSSRDQIRELIEKGSDALTELVKIAKASESPRAFEVAATMLRAVADTSNDLIELHKKRMELAALNSPRGRTDDSSVAIDKAIFVGFPHDLLRQMKEIGNGNN